MLAYRVWLGLREPLDLLARRAREEQEESPVLLDHLDHLGRE